MNIGDLIVKCLDNGGVGDCPYKPFCVARLTDRTITGCNMPFIWMGMLDKSKAVVEHTIKPTGMTLEQALEANPYDPAKGNEAAYVRYLRYNVEGFQSKDSKEVAALWRRSR